jgi:hypothetical protein
VGHARQPVPDPGTVYTSTPWSNVVRTISRVPVPVRSPIDGAPGEEYE